MPNSKLGKSFVLDTNVLLYDHQSIFSFQEHDVIIPILVLEELDKLKKGTSSVNLEAREAIRVLDSLTESGSPTEGIPLGPRHGNLYINVSNERSKLEDVFFEHIPEHRILSLCYNLKAANPDKEVVLVSKDINLRIKAKSLQLVAQDYQTGKTSNELYSGIQTLENLDSSNLEKIHSPPYAVEVSSVTDPSSVFPNQYMILRNGSSSAIGVVTNNHEIQKVERHKAFGIEPRNVAQIFSLHCLLDQNIKLVTLVGKAGTGKTLLALASAIEQRRYYSQILLARPMVPLANKEIGYLPGDIQSKVDPYMQPLWDNLSVIRHSFDPASGEVKKIDEMLSNEKLVIAPLAFIRGRSLSKVFFIVDEAQNLTPHEVKTIITRAGEGTKIVFTGDIHQIDSPYLDSKSNGLAYLVDRMRGQSLYSHVTLSKGERSGLAELASNLL